MNQNANEFQSSVERTRYIGLDFLKIALVILVIISHSALPYFIGPNGIWYFHPRNYNSYFFTPWFFSANAFIINTFFFIAGILSYYSLKRHSVSNFIENRTKRLLVPLIFGFLFIIPPLQYYAYLNYEPVTQVSFFNYLFSYWFGLDPKPANWVGHYPDMNLGHLWFLEHLIIYSFLLVSLIYILKKFSFTIKLNFYFFVFIITITACIATYIIRIYYPVTEMSAVFGFIQLDYTHVPQNFILFFSGVYFAKSNFLIIVNDFIRKIFFLFGSFLALLPFIIFYLLPSFDFLFYDLIFFSIWESLTAVIFSIGSVLYLSKVFKKDNIVIKRLGDLSYIMYVIHVIFVVSLEIFLENLFNNPILKFLLVSIGGIILTITFSYVLLMLKDNILKPRKIIS